ncbi:MAG: hypothetical protein AAF532_09720 [Planctomycetota bacterium]
MARSLYVATIAVVAGVDGTCLAQDGDGLRLLPRPPAPGSSFGGFGEPEAMPPMPDPSADADGDWADLGVVTSITGELAVGARLSSEWQIEGVDVALLRGGCRIEGVSASGGRFAVTCDRAVLWRGGQGRAVLYVESNVSVDRDGVITHGGADLLELAVPDGFAFDVPVRGVDVDDSADPVFRRADARQRAVFGAAASGVAADAGGPTVGADPVPRLDASSFGGIRHVTINSRSGVPFSVVSQTSDATVPPEQVVVITGGINMLIRGLDGIDQLGAIGMTPRSGVGIAHDVVDLSADRVVVWTRDAPGMSFEAGGDSVQSADAPMTIYLEGNIVIRQGGRKITASRAIYDARTQRAVLDDAELRAFMPEFGGDLRVRAERLRQFSTSRFRAEDAWLSMSRFGQPGYRVQSDVVVIEPEGDDPWVGLGDPAFDPRTGESRSETHRVRSKHNRVLVHDVPVLYLPYLSSPLESPNVPLRGFRVGNDRRFGFRTNTTWDLFAIAGREQPDGVRSDLLVDYYSERGAGLGNELTYHLPDAWGLPGSGGGRFLGYYVNDGGEDILGAGREDLPFEDANRGRLLLRHRHVFAFADPLTVRFELGYESDRNFLEQYFEPEFDSGKDTENVISATQAFENWSWSLLGSFQLNEFETETEWLPRFDLFTLGEPLATGTPLAGLVDWSQHTQLGYASLNPGELPDDELFPAPFVDQFAPLDYTADVEGAVLMTRHELNTSVPVGPFVFNPFVFGEALFQEEGLDGEQVTRLTGAAGLRSSIQFHKVFPRVRSTLLNLNGLAHKIRFETEYRFTDSSEPLGSIAQYNDLDDDAQERVRQRIVGGAGPGGLPPTIDPRIYGVRTGTGTAISSPVYELLEDQQVLRLALRQRWQTKRGAPGNLRIKDWLTVDLEASFFPDADRDNFGEPWGLIGADVEWWLGDRTSLYGDFSFDPFANAVMAWTAGLRTNRPGRGSLDLALHRVESQLFEQTFFVASFNYEMGPKWRARTTATFDIENPDNRTQDVTITRIGADWLTHVSVFNNESTGDFGAGLMIEPKFGNRLLPGEFNSLFNGQRR